MTSALSLAFARPSTLLRPSTTAPFRGASVCASPPKLASSVRVHASLRHVAQVRPRPVPLSSALPTSIPAVHFTLRDRLLFWGGEYLMWHPGAKVIVLFILTLLGIALGSLLFRAADPQRAEAQYPFWHAVRAVANPLEDDWASAKLRAVSVTLASIGMIVFAILVGMVTESVEAAVRNADGGFSKVVARDHVVILGWGGRASQTLKDLNRVGGGAFAKKVVVLANSEEQEIMKEELRNIMDTNERSNIHLLYRRGAPVLAEDLARVSAATAKKIVLINSRSGDPVDADRTVLSRALALSQNLPQFKGDIVAELNNPRDETILRSVLSRTSARSVETVNAERLLFRFMAQAIRQPGLADVVARLMGGDESSVFHVRTVAEAAPQLAGIKYANVRPTAIPGSIICGYFDENGKAHIQSGGDKGPTLTRRSNLLLLGEPGARRPARLQKVDASKAELREAFTENSRDGAPESFLVCGWRPDMEDMVRELDATVPKGSKMIILDNDVPEKIQLKLKNLSVKCLVKRPDRFENLEALLGPKASTPFNHVVLLGSALGIEDNVSVMGADEDSKALATMVYVNELLASRKDAKDTLVTVEFNNERVADIAREQANVANAMLPQNLSAKIAAQTMRDSRLNAVWSELLSQEGREVYLMSAQRYIPANAEKSFGSIADDAARVHDDVVIGFVAKGSQPIINPQGKNRWESREWLPGDLMIVLAHEK